MSPAAAWIIVALIAVLVAVAVPVLLQLKRTLGTADRILEIAERRSGVVLDQLTDTLGHINRSAEELERVTGQLSGVFNSVQRVGSSVRKIRSSLGSATAIGAAVGPVLVATIRGALGTWMRRNHDDDRHRMPVAKEIH